MDDYLLTAECHNAEILGNAPSIREKDIEVKATSTDLTVKESEMNVSNFILHRLDEAWQRQNLSVDEICKLALTTQKVLQARRDFFDGKEPGKDKKKNTFEAL